MNDIHIYWHHVGREHGGMDYAETLQKNSPTIVEQYLRTKEQRLREAGGGHRYVEHDDATLVELPPIDSPYRFLIVYFRDLGLQCSLGYKRHPWWLIDIVDIEERVAGLFCIHDLFVDIQVNPDRTYQVMDMEDFAAAVRLAILSPDEIATALWSLQKALAELNAGLFPGERLRRIQQHYDDVF